MPRFNDIINNFINGEVSPKAYGRSDSEIYKRACKRIENMIIHPQGGASRRVGTDFITKYLSDLSDSGNLLTIEDGARIIPFVYSKDEAYILIFNKHKALNINILHYYWVQGGFFDAKGITATKSIVIPGPISQRIPSTVSNVRTSDQLQDSDVLRRLSVCQVGGIMFFAEETIPPFCVIRTAEGVLQPCCYAQQYSDAAANGYGPFPFMDQNTSDMTLKASATTGVITITASEDFFDEGHVGTFFAFQDSSNVGIAYVTDINSATGVDAVVYKTLPADATNDTKQWYECAWSDYRGWPRSVAYWNGALYFGGSPTFPDMLWKSQTFDLFEMSNETVLDPGETPAADDPFYASLATVSEVSEISWLQVSGNDLLVGSRGREYAIDAFEHGNINVKPQTGYGSENVQPVMVDDTVVYVQRGGRKLREIIYDERTAGYVSPDITFLAEHIVRHSQNEFAEEGIAQVKELAYQALDNNIIWAIDTNGYLFGCTKSRENAVVAWHRHELGGNLDRESPKVLSIAVVPSKDGGSDDLYMLVKRTIDSTAVIYLERLRREFYENDLNQNSNDIYKQPIFTDCSKVLRTYQANTVAAFYARLKSSINADKSVGSATGTATGTLSFVDNMLLLNSSEYVTYDGTSNADFAQVGCIRLKVHRPNASRELFSISESAASNNNLISLAYSTLNGFVLNIKDSTGTDIIASTNLGFPASLVTNYTWVGVNVIELNYDLINGATRLFVNGRQVGPTLTATGTRSTTIGNIKLGAAYDGSNTTGDMLVSDFAIWDTVQHTANHDVPYDYQEKVTTIDHLEHLEGEEVAVVADGIYLGDFTVSEGSISLGGVTTYNTIIVGLKYTYILEPLPIDAGAGIGSAQGAIKRIDRAVIRFRDTAAASVGTTEALAEEITFRADGALSTKPIDLVTDDKVVEFPGDYTRLATCVITGSDPLPCNVTCAVFRGQTYD